jgi:CubicO group peptidase (beta-lactamase class C family)
VGALQAFLEAEVFGPLGMARTAFGCRGQLAGLPSAEVASIRLGPHDAFPSAEGNHHPGAPGSPGDPNGAYMRGMGQVSEKDAMLAQMLGQFQPFIAVFPQERMGQLASFGPT